MKSQFSQEKVSKSQFPFYPFSQVCNQRVVKMHRIAIFKTSIESEVSLEQQELYFIAAVSRVFSTM
jgi:hypothetical protein